MTHPFSKILLFLSSLLFSLYLQFSVILFSSLDSLRSEEAKMKSELRSLGWKACILSWIPHSLLASFYNLKNIYNTMCMCLFFVLFCNSVNYKLFKIKEKSLNTIVIRSHHIELSFFWNLCLLAPLSKRWLLGKSSIYIFSVWRNFSFLMKIWSHPRILVLNKESTLGSLEVCVFF